MPNPFFNWNTLPPLPPAPGQSTQPGVAGAFVGVSQGALIVAGGTNFPDAPPWQGGTKTWWNTAYILEHPAGPWYTAHLPAPLGYGVSYSTPHGLICAGGAGPQGTSADVFLLEWDPKNKQLHHTALPSLPEPMYLSSGASADGHLYLAGGQIALANCDPTPHAYVLAPSQSSWQPLPNLPATPRVLSISFALPGHGFYLMSGRRQLPGQSPELFRDAYRYNPAARSWTELKPTPVCFMAGTSLPLGHDQALILGGDSGELFFEKEALAQRIQAQRASQHPDLSATIAAEQHLLKTHPGFSPQIRLYHSPTDTWQELGHLPVNPPVTATATWWQNRLVVPSGEIRPGIRTPTAHSASLTLDPRSIRTHYPAIT